MHDNILELLAKYYIWVIFQMWGFMILYSLTHVPVKCSFATQGWELNKGYESG